MNLCCFVMMQFSGGHQESIFRHIEEAITRFNRIKGCSIKVVRADLTPPLDIEKLEDHLKALIERSDFVIAEITQLNPNVLFEMGFAIGVKKPVIIMVQEDTDIPADFRGRLFFQYKEQDLNLIPQMLQGYIKSAIDSILVQQCQTIYSAVTFENRAVSDLTKCLVGARDRVDILLTNLDYIVASGWTQILGNGMKDYRSLKIRILTLDPESDISAERARQLGFSIRAFRHQLRKSIANVKSSLKGHPEQFKIAIYDEFPTQITFRIDEIVFVNVLSASRWGRENILFKLKASNAGVSSSVLSHFDTVWGRSVVLTDSTET